MEDKRRKHCKSVPANFWGRWAKPFKEFFALTHTPQSLRIPSGRTDGWLHAPRKSSQLTSSATPSQMNQCARISPSTWSMTHSRSTWTSSWLQQTRSRISSKYMINGTSQTDVVLIKDPADEVEDFIKYTINGACQTDGGLIVMHQSGVTKNRSKESTGNDLHQKRRLKKPQCHKELP